MQKTIVPGFLSRIESTGFFKQHFFKKKSAKDYHIANARKARAARLEKLNKKD